MSEHMGHGGRTPVADTDDLADTFKSWIGI